MSATILILSPEEVIALDAHVDWEAVGPQLQRVAERVRRAAERRRQERAETAQAGDS